MKKRIKGYPKYTIYSNGTIFSDYTGKFLCTTNRSRGYNLATLTNQGEKKSFTVHRLVAKHFIPNPENKKEVNHINGIKTDNRVDNLEWVTSSENKKHAYKSGIVKSHNSKTVTQQTLDGDFIAQFKSISEASKATGIVRSSIGFCANGLYSQAGGFKWTFNNYKPE